jgi:excisionase family DNA binding protein
VSDRPFVPPPRVSAHTQRDGDEGTKGRTTARLTRDTREVAPMANSPRPTKGTLGGSNKMLSSREVAAILSVPERTVRDKWREWGLPAYRIGKHLRWRERDLYAWIEHQEA